MFIFLQLSSLEMVCSQHETDLNIKDKDTTLCDQVCQCLAAGWFSPSPPVSSTIKTDHHDITVILLTMVLNTKTLTPQLRKRQRTYKLKRGG
jgi:hypothetical protein